MYDKSIVAERIDRWCGSIEAFSLPSWEQLPDLGLYMDQVVILLTQYLDYLPAELRDERVITASTINNYVRVKAMPEPVKKKYYRAHLAYLVMICTLKQGLSIAMIQKLIPLGLTDEELRALYTRYTAAHRADALAFAQEIRAAAAPLTDPELDAGQATAQTVELITSAAVTCGFARMLAEALIPLDGVSAPEAD